ncbi:MAG TPA: NIPSNAP family protein [Gammaproteobacteria bacterium]
MPDIDHLQEFDVIELRRYTIRDGERGNFARHFESHFPEAFQQLGAIAFGEGFERGNAEWFTWLRGFRNMPARAEVNTAFYYGPLWKEHRNTLNGLMLDSDNVLLLKPVSEKHRIPVLPAVDAVAERDGAHGVIVLQLFALKADGVDSFLHQAKDLFGRYREAGIRDAGLLATLDEPNNFPQLPVRTDGPYVAWIGIAKDEAMLAAFKELAARLQPAFAATGQLRGEPELVILDPAPRSRLRWLAG